MVKVTFRSKKTTTATSKKCGSGKYSAVAKEIARLRTKIPSMPYDSKKNEYATNIHQFLSKGPTHVLQTFEEDKTLLNSLIANGTEFFRAATRRPHRKFTKQGIRVFIGPYDLQLSPNEFGVDDITKLIEFGFTYTPQMFRLDSDPSAALLRFACRTLSNEEKSEIVYPTPKRYGNGNLHYSRVLRQLGLPTTGNTAQMQERLLQFLGASKPVSLVECVVEDAKKYGVNLDANALSKCGCSRLHNWYREQFNKKYSNAGAFAAKVKKLILKDVCSFNLQPAKKKSSYEALEDVLSKKKDVSKHAFQQIIDAGFVGEEILFGAHHRYANLGECGIITNITPTQITYRPYGKKEVTNESETIKVCSNLLTGEGMIEKSVTVRKQYWDKKNLGQPKVYKKSYATKGRFLSFKLRAKTNNKTKFSNGYKAMSLLRLKWQPDPRNDIRGGCWCYEYEILSGSIKTKGGWVYDQNYESRFDYLTHN